MTVEGLMSMQTTLTQAGSRLPTATEWSMVAIIRQNVTPRIAGSHLALGFEHVGDHVGQGAVVADAAGEQKVDVVLTHSYMMPDLSDALVDRVPDRPAAANAVDCAQMMFVAGFGDAGVGEVDAEARAEQRLFDVVRGERVAGEQLVDVAAANKLAQVRAAAGMDDRRPADDERLPPPRRLFTRSRAISRISAPLGFSVDTPLDMNVKSLRTSLRSTGITRTPAWPMTICISAFDFGHRNATGGRGLRWLTSTTTPQSISWSATSIQSPPRRISVRWFVVL